MKSLHLSLAAIFLLLQPCWVCADVHLPSIISELMVLEQAAAVPLWGRADANEDVTVTLGDRTARTRAGSDGKWMVRLDLRDCGPGPFQPSFAVLLDLGEADDIHPHNTKDVGERLARLVFAQQQSGNS